jgi:uncharacterized membrane protein YphA (DoxX/SURF4 family)
MRLVYPIGSPRIAPLLIRMPLGFYLFLTGFWAVIDPLQCSSALQNYTGTLNMFFRFYAVIAPYLAMGTGVLIMLGLFTTGAAFIAACLILPLSIAAGVFSQGIGNISPYLEHRMVFRDAVLLGVSLSLLFSGPGVLSIDLLLQKLYGKGKAGPP